MHEHQAVRRLVKSPPELWAQCSDPASLARHLNGFGEIRITRLEPENTVAWEGESASGTVCLEASGWGTRVRLTAGPPPSGPEPAVPPRGLAVRVGSLLKRPRELAASERPSPSPSPSLLPELEAALDSLGQAHHRPYSRG